MKLTEVSKIPQQTSSGFNLEDFDLKSAEQLTTAENIPLVHFAGGGPRRDAHRMVCLVKDAKYFVYYLRRERLNYVEPIRVDPKLSNKELMDLCGLS